MSEVHLLQVRMSHGWSNPAAPTENLIVRAECPALDDHCRAFVMCEDKACDRDELERLNFDQGDDEPQLHGVRHKYIDGDYMVPTDECFVTTNASLWEIAEVFVQDNQLGEGDYVVAHDFGDSGELIAFHSHGSEWPPE